MIAPLLLLLAADLPLGRVIDAVPTTADPKQSYALYLPSNYKSDKVWPVLYCLDPGARGRVPVERFAKAAEAEGFIVAGSNNSRNGPMGPVQVAINAMVNDTGARFAVDPNRSYAAGHSGGSRVALAWGQQAHLAGVVACGAAFGQQVPSAIHFKLFAAAGIDDFNYDELYELSASVARTPAHQRFEEFAGGHEWLPEAQALDALRFFNGKLPDQPAPVSKDQHKDAARLREMLARLDAASSKGKLKLIDQLRQQSEAAEDSADRRLARRTLGGAFIGAMEQSRAALERSDKKQAITLLEFALAIRPDAANVKAMLERAKSQ